ncbi:glycosyltransferase family 2 protein [Azonexus sp. IMCC34842]|uniref:glycosyltransferase family 2 protein n=1 Tax=Azonexus sp. IMCC34842 TaxID=3420950 RepID=UPI003D0D4272
MDLSPNRQSVSVVITTYNRDDLLEETLVSLADQTVSLHEIVVVDDGGSGSAKAVVERFGTSFHYFWQPNGGMQSARNLGIEKSTGDWIAFLDDDDLWEKDRHALLMELISTNQVDLIFGDFRKFDADGLSETGVFEEITRQSPGFFKGISQPLDADVSIVGSFPTTHLFPVNPFWPSTLAIRRDLQQRVGFWDIALRGQKAEDFDYVFRAIKAGRLGMIWKPSVRYRCHAGNFSVGKQLVSLGRVAVWQRLIKRQFLTAEEQEAILFAIHQGLVEAHWTAFSSRKFKTVIDIASQIGWDKLSATQKVKTGIAILFSPFFRGAND